MPEALSCWLKESKRNSLYVDNLESGQELDMLVSLD